MLLSMTERFAASRSALLIIDMQKNFCAAGFGTERLGRDISAARAAIPRICALRQPTLIAECGYMIGASPQLLHQVQCGESDE